MRPWGSAGLLGTLLAAGALAGPPGGWLEPGPDEGPLADVPAGYRGRADILKVLAAGYMGSEHPAFRGREPVRRGELAGELMRLLEPFSGARSSSDRTQQVYLDVGPEDAGAEGINTVGLLGLVSDAPDFEAGRPVTRCELAELGTRILDRAAGRSPRPWGPEAGPCAEPGRGVPDPVCRKRAEELGLLRPTSERGLNYEAPVDRYALATFLAAMIDVLAAAPRGAWSRRDLPGLGGAAGEPPILAGIPYNHWAKAAVRVAWENGLLGSFRPSFHGDAKVTRYQAAQVLNLFLRRSGPDGIREAAQSFRFHDVPAGHHHAEAVARLAAADLGDDFGTAFRGEWMLTWGALARLSARLDELAAGGESARARPQAGREGAPPTPAELAALAELGCSPPRAKPRAGDYVDRYTLAAFMAARLGRARVR